ncbi:methyl-accepting chemotaxis sensory transducer with Pas/Pac sensor [Arboricoccus pini]|uniref:Methyl-accepting chemotaxis sensory transducer with Pas/Pac sensor n=1 Tax=Arboricoccus pini TaxID=1963835 RepID=A0A212QCB9_9PROT|nr:methyl-accepting chemotaxis protein [Arboricoccus pini]SNB56867.1 methyl-accepting chemotaxis sensory transducer with Pas/Pac sensor [Arboricoccus pini]
MFERLTAARRTAHSSASAAIDWIDDQGFFLQVIDQAPINVMVCDAETLVIRYANAASLHTLKSIEHLLPVTSDRIVGSCIDVFHRHPAHQRAMLADPANLPHRARIKLGQDYLDLFVTALMVKGAYKALLLTWSVATQEVRTADRFEREVKGAVQSLGQTVPELGQTASILDDASTDAASQARNAAEASRRLADTTDLIARHGGDVANVADKTQESVAATNRHVADLKAAANDINTVTDLIRSVAEQTNLLALNATIEAARAGEAGRGFAVVAAEVKALAAQTATATGDIASRIAQVGRHTDTVMAAITEMERETVRLRAATDAISGAVENQSGSTKEARQAIESLLAMSERTQEAAKSLTALGDGITQEVAALDKVTSIFLEDVRRK